MNHNHTPHDENVYDAIDVPYGNLTYNEELTAGDIPAMSWREEPIQGHTPPGMAPQPEPVPEQTSLVVSDDGFKLVPALPRTRGITRRDLLISSSSIVVGGVAGGGLIAYLPRFMDIVHSDLLKDHYTDNGQEDDKDSDTSSAQSIALYYSRDLTRWHLNGYNPKLIDLSTVHPIAGTPLDTPWIDPPQTTLQRVYGILSFGDDTHINVVLDGIDTDTPLLYLTFHNSVDFSRVQSRPMPGGSLPDAVEFDVKYADGRSERFAIFMYIPSDYNQRYGTTRIAYYIASFRQGTLYLQGKPFRLAITNEKVDALYSNLDASLVWFDINKNSYIPDSDSFFADTPFVFNDTAYIIDSISRSGNRMVLRKAQTGTFKVRVTAKATGLPIAGAGVTLERANDLCQDISGTTALDGYFTKKALEGHYRNNLIVRASGYVPYVLSMNALDQPKATVQRGKTLNMEAALATATFLLNSHVRLKINAAYHFLAATECKPEEGDISIEVYGGDNRTVIFANYDGQRGIWDLGQMQINDLAGIHPPEMGYSEAAYAVNGHIYVVQARIGEEGHFIIFRITSQDAHAVDLDFVYK